MMKFFKDCSRVFLIIVGVLIFSNAASHILGDTFVFVKLSGLVQTMSMITIGIGISTLLALDPASEKRLLNAAVLWAAIIGIMPSWGYTLVQTVKGGFDSVDPQLYSRLGFSFVGGLLFFLWWITPRLQDSPAAHQS